MIRYQQLEVIVPGSDYDGIIALIIKALPSHWVHGADAEAELPLLSDQKIYCFQRKRDDGLDANLWLAEKRTEILFVSNIVPTQTRELVVSDYNSILVDFYESGVISAVSQTGGKAELSSAEYSLEDLISIPTSKALRLFSSNANKSTGTGHPSDRRRWFEFMSLAYSDSKNLPTEELEKYLMEDGWSENSALDLAIQYEYGIDLLAHVEKCDASKY